MARHRTRVRISRSLRAAAVVVVAAVASTAIFEADIGRSMLLPSSLVAGVPPVLYLVLSILLLRGAPVGRRLSWTIAACGLYAALGLLSGVLLSMAHPMSMEGALRRSLWSFAPAPIIHLIAAPLVLLAWRSRIIPVRFTQRTVPESSPLVNRVPAPPLPASTPDWDSVLQVETPAPWTSSPKVFERPAREREAVPEPTTTVTAAAAATVSAPAPAAGSPAPMVATAAPTTDTAPSRAVVMEPAPRPPAEPSADRRDDEDRKRRATRPAENGAAPDTSPRSTDRTTRPAAEPARPADKPARTVAMARSTELTARPAEESAAAPEPMVRVPFERVADQLPVAIFTLPPARLAESLQEPHTLVIPQRLVLPQLAEGMVEIPWTLVDAQFPELSLAMSKTDIRRRHPDLAISLPMDVVLRQIPTDAIRVDTPVVDLSDIGAFPEPFAPGEPEPVAAATPEPEPAPSAEPVASRAPASPAPIVAPPVQPPKPEVIAAAPPRIEKPEPTSAPALPSPKETLEEIEASIPMVLFTPMASPPPAEEAASAAADEPGVPSAREAVPSPSTALDREPAAPAPMFSATAYPSSPATPMVSAAASTTAPEAPPAPSPAPIMPVVPVAAATPSVPATAAESVPTAASTDPRTAAADPDSIAVAPKAPAASSEPATSASDLVDEESEALGRALAPGLSPLGSFYWRARRAGGRPLVCFVPPSLEREAIDALAMGAASVVHSLAARGIEQVTVRTTRLVCVLTPLGKRGCLAASARRGGPVAMLELLSVRTARAMGDLDVPTTPAAVLPSVPTTPVRGNNGHGPVDEAARALAAFGPVASSVAEADGMAPSVYVFAGHDQNELAGAARAVHEAFVRGHDEERLGRLESIVLRRGRERTVVRPLRDHNGTPVMLAAAGDVALPGRAHRAAAQAAALLEAH